MLLHCNGLLPQKPLFSISIVVKNGIAAIQTTQATAKVSCKHCHVLYPVSTLDHLWKSHRCAQSSQVLIWRTSPSTGYKSFRQCTSGPAGGSQSLTSTLHRHRITLRCTHRGQHYPQHQATHRRVTFATISIRTLIWFLNNHFNLTQDMYA